MAAAVGKQIAKLKRAPWLMKAGGFMLGGGMLMSMADTFMRSGRLDRLKKEVPELGELGYAGEHIDDCLMPLFYLRKAAIGENGLAAYGILCRAFGRMVDDMNRVYGLQAEEAARLPLQFMTSHFQYICECVTLLFEQSAVPMRKSTDEELPFSFGLDVPTDPEWRHHMFDLLEYAHNEILNCEQDIRTIVAYMADSEAHQTVAAGQDAAELKAISMGALGLTSETWPPVLGA